MPTSGEIVDEFIRAYVRRDADAALELVTDDFVFEHVPMPESTIVRGKEQLRERIAGAVSAAERVDDFYFPEGTFARTHTSTRVAGVFELRDGKIAAWRDYYDLKSGWLDQVGIEHAGFVRSLATRDAD